MKRLKIKWNIMLVIALLILTMIFVYNMCRSSNQAMTAIGLDVGFEGQFSYDEDSRPMSMNQQRDLTLSINEFCFIQRCR